MPKNFINELTEAVFIKGLNVISKETVSRSFTVITILILYGLLTACQPVNQGSRTFTTNQDQPSMRAFNGKILHVDEVQIQRDETGPGAVAFEVLGGVVDSPIGGGRGTTLATIGGTAAGTAAERTRRMRPAWELEVELEDNTVLVIVQEQDDVFKVGDHVRVIEGRDGSFRVRQ